MMCGDRCLGNFRMRCVPFRSAFCIYCTVQAITLSCSHYYYVCICLSRPCTSPNPSKSKSKIHAIPYSCRLGRRRNHQYHQTPLFFPSPIPTPSPPNLPPLQPTHPHPLASLRIHIPTRLNRNPLPRSHPRDLNPITPRQLRHINMLARIKLKRRFRAQYFEM